MRKGIVYQDEMGGWVATVPSFPGCHTDGATRDEAIVNLHDAVRVWMDTQAACGEPIPPTGLDVQVVLIPVE